MSETLKEKTAKGLLWGGLNSTVQQLLGIVFGIILARRLNQSDFGMIAMITIFQLIGNDLQNSGFKVALANLRQPTDRDYNSVFWFNILMGGSLYILLFLCAPLIASFYHIPSLTPLARYAFLSIVFASFGTAQSAWLFKNLRAKQQAKAGMMAVLISSSVAVVMAYMGFAYWALATQTNLYILLCTLFYWYYSPWRPTLSIDLKPALRMFRFSVKLLISQVLTDINNNVLNILLGRFYGRHDTGNYNQAFQWSTKGSNIIQNMVQQVAQPVLVSVDDEHERQLRVLRKMMRFAAFLSFPLLLGLSLVSHEFIVTLLGEKWAESANYLRWLAIGSAFLPLSTLLANVVITKGRSNIFMYVNLALALCQTATMLAIYHFQISLPFFSLPFREGLGVGPGVGSPLYTMVIAFVALTILWFFVWAFFARRLAGYRLTYLLRDVLPFLFAAAAVMLITGFVTSLIIPSTLLGGVGGGLLLLTRIIIAALLYYVVMRLFRVEILNECLAFLKHKNKNDNTKGTTLNSPPYSM
ncbi:MAG: lipopolysaccharide biosynthesis protein [Prevotella sp.]|nr:lipopolysaccharide biosynthesis protein [Prevotella sp.]